MTVSAPPDRLAKIRRLMALLDARDASALRLTTGASLSWLFDGARVSVPYGAPPVCTALVHRTGEVVVTALSNEVERLRTEEIGEDTVIRAVPWFDALPVDGGVPESEVAAELRAARAVLLPAERAHYASFASDTARAIGEVLRGVNPVVTEHELAARLVAAVVALGAEPIVTLVAGERRTHVPHPLPTAAPLGRRAMAVVGARRRGLVVNLTRWVSFGAIDPDAAATLREVEADAFAATAPGRELRDVLGDIAASYARHGLGEAAWRRHHQGGPTGYLGRDPKATPLTTDVVAAGQAFAWNPWVPGAKCEDTVIVEHDRVDVLTTDPTWPSIEVRGIPRPLTLELE